MGQAVISSNTSLKVNRAITAATTVNANCYAIVEYYHAGYTQTGGGVGAVTPIIATRHFGPLQSVPANFLIQCDPDLNNAGAVLEARYALLSGVEFINSP